MHDLQQLERVLALKSLGLSLKEITRLRQVGAPKRTRAKAALPEVLARRRAALEEKREQIDRAVRAIDATARDDHPAAALDRFFGEANWDRWEAKRHAEAAAGFSAPDRASPSRLALFREIAAALDRDPSGGAARPLVARWHALLEAEAGGDADTAAKAQRRGRRVIAGPTACSATSRRSTTPSRRRGNAWRCCSATGRDVRRLVPAPERGIPSK